MNENLKIHLTHEAARARRARIAELIRGIDGAPGIPRAEAVKLVDIDPGPNPDPQPVGPPAGPRVIVVNEYGTPDEKADSGEYQYMKIECDYTMVKHLLRLWTNNRLRPQGVCLAKERPRLMKNQGGLCSQCNGVLVNDGKQTHIDHVVTVKTFAYRVMAGELTFDDAYLQLWDDSNIRAIHSKCNYARNRKAALSI